MCVRCHEAEASGDHDLGLCQSCAIVTCIEFLNGLEQLERYLEAHAAFDRWLGDREIAA